jgi:replication factor C small subunit
MSVELWVEKYRPNTLDEFVWKDTAQRKTAEEWIKQGAFPHLMFSGVQGSGKTSLAKLLLKMLNIPRGDILEINASRERQVDVIQDRIVNFVQTWALGPTGIKYIILDEADSMSQLAQRVLRGEMEKYHDMCRFILTCNYPERIIPAIHSRCQGYRFGSLDSDEFTARVGEILVTENVNFEVDDLLVYVEKTYPDLRKCINLAQQHSSSGTLAPLEADEEGTKDYLVDMVNLFNSGKFLEARKLVVGQAQVEEYPEIFKFMYRNLNLWGATEDKQDEALLIIRRGLVNHAVVADFEINLAATLAELSRLAKS